MNTKLALRAQTQIQLTPDFQRKKDWRTVVECLVCSDDGTQTQHTENQTTLGSHRETSLEQTEQRT